MTAAPIVETRALTRVFREAGRDRRVLDGVDLAIGRGELVVLLGRSGSGKSTLLNLMGGLDRPTTGDVLLDSVALGPLDETARTLLRRRHVGFIFQAMNLVPTLDVLDNVLLPLELNGQVGADARRRALDLLAEVGLDDRTASYPDRLSGGEQQRVAIARALVHDPSLILADEPTGNLDLATARRVVELLDRMSRAAGKTLVMATHGREVIGIADRILTLEAGRMCEHGAEP